MQLNRTVGFAVGAYASAMLVACGGGDSPSAPIVVGTITISPATASVAEGGTTRLTAEVKSTDGKVLTGRKVTWTSTNPATATVSDSGVVTGVAVGATQVTAATEGKSAITAINVTLGPCNVSQATPIVANTLVNGTLATSDCDFGDGTFLDAYSFVLTFSTNVDILMRSAAFDAFLYVYTMTSTGLQERANDDNSGGGTDARLTGLLTAGTYFILANSNNISGFGAYTLQFTSPFAGLNASSVLFGDAPSPVALRRLTGAEARSFRAFARKH